MENITADSFDEIADIQGKTFYKLAINAGKSPDEALLEGNNHNRDKSRSPMQWDNSTNAGFTTGKPWIKLNQNYREVNVKTELRAEKSMLITYKALLLLRNTEKALQYGSYDKLERKDDLICFSRTYKKDKITVMINFGKEQSVLLPKDAIILMGNTTLKQNDFLIIKSII